MDKKIPVSEHAVIAPSGAGPTHEVAADVAYQRLLIVNVVFVGPPKAPDRGWALVDAGLFGSAGAIAKAAAKRFGSLSRPSAIILTHGHFDHVGALRTLAERWDVPILAHPLEAPYLDGTASYPPPDPSVGGGAMAALSRLYPRGPVDVSSRLELLPSDGRIPGLDGWRWIATPGHSVGHVSLWREQDGVLIAGDAFVTTRQESASAVAFQTPEIHGPPAYYTVDWSAARLSVQMLADMQPDIVVTGHGRPMQGAEMRRGLQKLADEFATIAVPRTGRYVERPVGADDGSAYVRAGDLKR